MKRLANKTNVEAPSANYPYGKSKDDTGSGDGTPIDFDRLNDWDQLVERVFAKSEITANGLPDNATDGFQLYEAFNKHFRPYRQTVLNFIQGGTGNPTLSRTLLDELKLNVSNASITRQAAGSYLLTIPQQTQAKLAIDFGPMYGTNFGFASYEYTTSGGVVPMTLIGIYTRNSSGALTDGLLTAMNIYITVFD